MSFPKSMGISSEFFSQARFQGACLLLNLGFCLQT